MPHYANGREAKVGDVVVGRGYNVKGSDGTLREITGLVVSVTPGSASCNVQILHGFRPAELHPDGSFGGSPVVISGRPLWPQVEYGQADHFLHADDFHEMDRDVHRMNAAVLRKVIGEPANV